MKKTIASLLSALLFLSSCAFNTNINVPKQVEPSFALVRLKIIFHSKHEKDETGWGTCSGVYIRKNIILTAAHCVAMDPEKGLSLKQVWVKSNNQSSQAFPIRVDTQADLALLYTDIPGTPIKFAKKITRGEECWVIGNPLGFNDIVTKGIVSQTGVSDKNEKATFTIVDAVTLPGNSGGPVVDSDGHLIGILTRGTSYLGFLGASGLGLVVDLKTVIKFLNG